MFNTLDSQRRIRFNVLNNEQGDLQMKAISPEVAQELYEALKDLLEALAAGEGYGGGLVFALDKARVALAKVESQS
jgi:hypothetical protein